MNGRTVSSRASFCAAALALAALLAGGALAADTTRASVDSNGVESDRSSFYAAISDNGRFVGFVSRGTNLVPGGAQFPDSDVFVHDRRTGVTECISLDPAGVDGNEQSSFPALSANGRFVAFESRASNLVAEDNNEQSDVFVRDRKTGAIERVSVDAEGAESIGLSREAAISASGRFVAFESMAPTLVPDDGNGAFDVFVRDRKRGTIRRVSVGSGGTEAHGGDSANPSISANGNFIAFQSDATDLVPDDGNGKTDVFVHDRKLGVTERISRAQLPLETDGESQNPSISGNGRFVAFESAATNLVPDDVNEKRDIFLHDRKRGVTVRITRGVDGTEADGHSVAPVISTNGRWVVFESGASNLVEGDGNETSDVFAYDRKTGRIERVSLDAGGAEADLGGLLPAVSKNGRFVAFESDSVLVQGDGNETLDVYVRDRK